MNLWERTLTYSLLASFFLTFTEWLFFVTKPSFLSQLTLPQSLSVLLIAPPPFFVVILAVVAGLFLLQQGVLALGRAKGSSTRRTLVALCALIPASY